MSVISNGVTLFKPISKDCVILVPHLRKSLGKVSSWPFFFYSKIQMQCDTYFLFRKNSKNSSWIQFSSFSDLMRKWQVWPKSSLELWICSASLNVSTFSSWTDLVFWIAIFWDFFLLHTQAWKWRTKPQILMIRCLAQDSVYSPLRSITQ